MKRKIVCLDLFSGAGGLTEGFTNESFDIVAHIEKDLDACLTLKTRLSYHYLKNNNQIETYNNYIKKIITREELYSKVPNNILQSVINEEISSESFEKISKMIKLNLHERKIDVIFGGPPCQAYSLVGRARDKHSMRKDKRKYLYLEYIKYLKEFKPKYFVFENVKGMLSSKNEENELIIDKMVEDFEEAGFRFEYKVLNSKDFGVSQNRQRVVLFGYRKDLEFNYPNFDKKYPLTINDLFCDLPKLNSNNKSDKYNNREYKTVLRSDNSILSQHESRFNNERDLEIYRIAVDKFNENNPLKYNDLPKRLITHKNTKSFNDRFKVVDGNNISHTIVAHIAKDGHYYIHPDKMQNRSITVREAARIQSFPDNYYFEKSRTSAYRQIGNAVPPFMAKEISKKILEFF